MFKKWRDLDWSLYILPIALWLIGVSVLWSLTYASPDDSISSLAPKQVIFGIIGLGLSIVMALIDYRSLRQFAWIIGLGALILLLAVEFFGTTSLGATRWLDFKVFQLQPSEIAKVALIIVLATNFVQYIDRVGAKMFIMAGVIVGAPLFLVLKQPDLGTAIILVLSSLGVLLSMRMKRVHYIVLAIGLSLTIIIGVLAYQNTTPFSGILHNYQRDRIHVFLNPKSDPLGKGYNVRQSIIAIGNGGLFGRGLGKDVGQLSQLNLLPKAYTDFIFAALAESLGFIGGSVVLIIYSLILWRILLVAYLARDGFGALLAYGYLASILFSILINVGMNLGIMPVTGIPLPFISAGGTALITNFIGIGIIQSITSRRQKISFG